VLSIFDERTRTLRKSGGRKGPKIDLFPDKRGPLVSGWAYSYFLGRFLVSSLDLNIGFAAQWGSPSPPGSREGMIA